jgi:hypothetical protein
VNVPALRWLLEEEDAFGGRAGVQPRAAPAR